MRRNAAVLALLMVVATLFAAESRAASYDYDFGTGTATFEGDEAADLNWMPPAPSGVDRVFRGGEGGGFYLENSGNPAMGTNSELRIVGTNATGDNNINKLQISNFAGATPRAYVRFSMTLEGSGPGTVYFLLGNGTRYDDLNNQTLSNAQNSVGMRWVVGAAGIVTAQYHNGTAWVALPAADYQLGQKYEIEIYSNNTGFIIFPVESNYDRNGTNYTVSGASFQLWVNNVQTGVLTASGLGLNQNIDSIMVLGENSTNASDPLSMRIDDLTYSTDFQTADDIAPSVTSINYQSPTAQYITDAQVTWQAIFNEAVAGVDSPEFSLFADGPTGAAITNIEKIDALTYNITASTGTGDGDLRLDLPASAIITDLNGNEYTTSFNSGQVYTIDRTVPTVSIASTGLGEYFNGTSFDVTATFSEDVTGFDASDIAVVNGTASAFSGSGSVYTFTVTPTDQGLVTVDIAAAAAVDRANNPSTAANTISTTFDTIQPGVTLDSTVGVITNAPFVVNATFTEDVTGFDATDIYTENGAVTNFSGSGATYSWTVEPQGNGTVTVSVPADVASDSATNLNTASTNSITTEFDGDGPTVTVSTLEPSPTNNAFDVAIEFSEPVADFVLEDISVENGSASTFSGSGTSYSATITPAADGPVKVRVPFNSATDLSSNPNMASNDLIVIYDATGPVGVFSGPADVNAPFTLTLTFDEPVFGFDLADFFLTNSTVSDLSVSANAYSFIVTPTDPGAFSVTLPANSVSDETGNENGEIGPFNGIYDTQSPTITLGSSVSGATNAPFTMTATVDEDLFNFDETDLTVANATISDFTAVDAANYSWTVTPTDAAVSVSVAANVANDAAGNGNVASTEFAITYDAIAPTVVLDSTSANPLNTAFEVTATYDEAVIGFDVDDITVVNGAASALSNVGNVYTFTVTPTADGQVDVSIAAAVAKDAAGNDNIASTVLSRDYDATAPTVSLASSSSAATNAPFEVTATFSEEVIGLNLAEIVVTNGTASNLGNVGGVYTFTVTPTADGQVDVSIPADVAQDAAGNNNTASDVLSRVYDSVAPTVVLASSSSPITNAPFEVTATFSEEVTGFDLDDIVVTNGTAGNLSNVGGVYTFTITPAVSGEVTVSIAAAVATDAAGNGNAAAAEVLTRTYDINALTVNLDSTVGAYANAPFTVTATFSKVVEDFTVDDVTVVNGQIVGFDGSGATYSWTVNPDAAGEVTVQVAADVATDAATNANEASNVVTTIFDAEKPQVVSITPSTTVPTKGPGVNFTVVFSEVVKNFDSSCVQINHSGTSNSRLIITGSGTTYTVRVAGIRGPGTFNITIVDDASVQDVAGNGLAGSLTSPTITVLETAVKNWSTYE